VDAGQHFRVFVRKRTRRANAWEGAVFLAIGLVVAFAVTVRNAGPSAGAVWGTRALGAVIAVLSAIWIYRAITGSRISTYENGFAVRQIMRTRWYGWSEVSSFGTERVVLKSNPWSRRCVLVFYKRQNRIIVTSFTAPERQSQEIVDVASALLRTQFEALSASAGP